MYLHQGVDFGDNLSKFLPLQSATQSSLVTSMLQTWKQYHTGYIAVIVQHVTTALGVRPSSDLHVGPTQLAAMCTVVVDAVFRLASKVLSSLRQRQQFSHKPLSTARRCNSVVAILF